MILLNNYITFPWRFLVLIFLLPRPRSFAYSRSFSCYLSKKNVTQLLTWVFRSSSQIQYLSPTLAKKKKKTLAQLTRILYWHAQHSKHICGLYNSHSMSYHSESSPCMGYLPWVHIHNNLPWVIQWPGEVSGKCQVLTWW